MISDFSTQRVRLWFEEVRLIEVAKFYSSVRSRERVNVPRHRNWKLVGENWIILQVYILSETMKKSKRYLGKIYEKVNFPKRTKNLKIYWTVFQIFFIFGPNAQGLAGSFPNFPCLVEGHLQLLIILNFNTNSSRFSPKFSRIFIRSKSPPPVKPLLSFW